MGLLIVVATLLYNDLRSIETVYQAVLEIDPSRIKTLQVARQRLRFSSSFQRVFSALSKQGIDLFHDFFIGRLPK
jgi:hypothetical protein